jgi:hypothetical protein
MANQDLLFVDPYLNAEFVSRYLSHVSKGVTIRLLAREKLATLLPAVELFAKQSGIQVRSAPHYTIVTYSSMVTPAISQGLLSTTVPNLHPRRSLR